MKATFAGRIRVVAKTLPKEGFTPSELSGAAKLVSRRELSNMRRTIQDMLERGEMKRLGPARYAYAGRSGPPQKQQVMWRYMRSGRSLGGVSAEELMEVAGASLEYVREWLDLLVRRGVAKEMRGKWQIVSDPVEMPVNDEKAEKLRKIRERKKQAVIQALERAGAAIAQAVEFVRGAE